MKNLKKLLVVCFVLVMSSNYAQKTKYGVRLGVGIPNLQSKDDNIYSKDYQSVTGFDGGIFGDFGITERFSIKAELAYTRKGGDRNGIQPIPSATLSSTPEGAALAGYLQQIGVETIYAEFDNVAVFNYVEIPILAKYEWTLGKNDGWAIYVNAGPYIDFMINPEQVTTSDGTVPIWINEAGTQPLMVPYPPDFQSLGPAYGDFTATTDISKDLATIDFGAMWGIGFGWNVSEHSQIFADIRGSYGFIPLQNDIDTYGTVHMGNMSFALGYAFQFKKKTKVQEVIIVD